MDVDVQSLDETKKKKLIAALRARKRLQKNLQARRVYPLPRFRVLPVTMALAVMLLGIKIIDVIDGSQRFSEALLATPAIAAEEEKEEEVAKEETKEGEQEAEKATDKKEDETKVAALEENVRPKEADIVSRNFSNVELDILQSLSQRREEIETYEKELTIKQKLLEATEMRINEKLETMKLMQVELDERLEEYKGEQDKQIMSLVKIYENMKPKDAADIFNEMEMGTLFDVIDKMSERKAAPVLAAMNPVKAMQVTTELAEQRKLRDAVERKMKKM